MLGRPRIPDEIKRLQGNPGRRELAPPRQGTKPPTCPRHLTGEARREWQRIVREVKALGLVQQTDRAALAAYCVLYARWVEAEEKLTAGGTVVNRDGRDGLNPHLAVANAALKLMHRYLVEFGLTPASRTRVIVPLPTEADPFTKFTSAAGVEN